jgi:hypothetical protein
LRTGQAENGGGGGGEEKVFDLHVAEPPLLMQGRWRPSVSGWGRQQGKTVVFMQQYIAMLPPGGLCRSGGVREINLENHASSAECSCKTPAGGRESDSNSKNFAAVKEFICYAPLNAAS